MKIERIHIENFGKIRDFDCQFGANLNEIFKENGWGKSTLATFLKAMFYGMPPARENVKNERKKYMPWQGGNFGGYVEYATDFGRFRLTRFFGKTPEHDQKELVNLSNNKIVDFPKCEIGEEIFGVGRDTFEKTAFFAQLNFQSSLNEQMSANLLGLEKFQYDLANINSAIDKIKLRLKELKKQKPKDVDVDTLKVRLKDLRGVKIEKELKLIEIEREISNLNKEIDNLNKNIDEVNAGNKIKGELYSSKENLEKQLAAKSQELNDLLLKLNEIENKKKETKINKVFPALTATAMLFLVALAVIFALSIINPLVFGVLFALSLTFSVVMGALFVFNLRKNRAAKQEIDRDGEEVKNIEKLRATIEILNSNLLSLKGVDKPETEQLNSLKEALFDKKLQLQTLKTKHQNLSEDIESDRDRLESVQEQIANFSSLQEKFDEKIQILNLTINYLLQAHENVSSRFVEPVNKAIKTLLEKFDLQGRKFVVNSNLEVLEETESGIKEIDYSSQGYKDLLSFCMRFYLVKEIFKKEKPFVVLDDIFVNLDDDNFNKAKLLLEGFSQDFQIIYICSNSRCKI